MWSLGCIFAELVTRRPILASDGSQIDQLFKIFQVFGVPNPEEWPEVVQLEHYKKTFPKFQPNQFLRSQPFLQSIGLLGIDLIESLLQMNPKKRINAAQARQHKFFEGYPKHLER